MSRQVEMGRIKSRPVEAKLTKARPIKPRPLNPLLEKIHSLERHLEDMDVEILSIQERINTLAAKRIDAPRLEQHLQHLLNQRDQLQLVYGALLEKLRLN